jgi:hypothetical protein
MDAQMRFLFLSLFYEFPVPCNKRTFYGINVEVEIEQSRFRAEEQRRG